MDERSLQLISAFAKLDPSPTITSALLAFAEVDKRWVRYMAGPVIIHRSPWAETLPTWMIPAIYADRAELIEREATQGTVGELATPLEVISYMYPATLDAPLSYEWVQVYLYCGQEALTKHNKLPNGQTFAQVIQSGDQPLQLDDYITSQFLIPLQRRIRSKVVQIAAERGIGKQPRPAPQEPAMSETNEQSGGEASPNPVQLNLFDAQE